ncbi:MAG: RNA methyltransferase [Chlorobiaceae bacterium]|jgi:23S rRNA (guanosine2251-2'-O)-methyltransferase|nr:RNA methyltransferase [Chlorobiaceae bacterium]
MMVFRQLAGEEMGRLTPGAYAVSRRHPVTLMLHNIRSMWNVGAMFRTADAAGIDRIVITGYTATPPRKEIDKTALGAQETVPWLHFDDPFEAISVLKDEGKKVYGLEIAENSRMYTDLKADDFPLVLLVGNEVDGIGDALLANCDGVLEIPQYGIKHSLNVAVAAGVAVFECVRVFRQPG